MKTAVTVLQELMVKLADTPEYECISQSGPQHSAVFEYRCAARGACVTAAARSKKEAKQEAARLMLLALASRGLPVPPPYGCAPVPAPAPAAPPRVQAAPATLAPSAPRSHVALLKDLCEEYSLPGAEYELVADTGPPHLRHFTVTVRVGSHVRLATSTTKKAARQLAAEQLYSYLRENLARVTKDFVEEEALVRAHEKAMERYVELRDESSWRPDLGQRVADYHLGLVTHTGEEKRVLALDALSGSGEGAAGAEGTLAAAAGALGLTVQYHALAAEADGELCVVELAPASPALAHAGRGRAAAAAAALRYLRLALAQPPPRCAAHRPTAQPH